jgi:hypothetical protein
VLRNKCHKATTGQNPRENLDWAWQTSQMVCRGNRGWYEGGRDGGVKARARVGGAHMVRRPRRLTSSAKLSGCGYPRPCDRRLSRKTRAAVGKPPGSTIVTPAVSSADSPEAICLPSGHYVNDLAPVCCSCNPHEVGAASAQLNFPLAESARLMPVTASPMPDHAGALAGLIS